MTKRIVLCADDYGQAPAISAGILDLLEKQRLSAVSCLTNFPAWREAAAKIASYSGQIDVGLHFNLTEGRPLSAAFRSAYGEAFFPLAKVLRRSFLAQFDRSILQEECEAQLAEFSAGTGFLPQFIDGHQHVHQFPIVREALLAVYERHLIGTRAYIRLAMPKLHVRHLKRLIILLSGALALRKALIAQNIPHNASFSGSYHFAEAAKYRHFFQDFLREIEDGGLIMCHPGFSAVGAHDPIGVARAQEYSYFASKEFLEDCQKYDVEIKRFAA